MPIDGLCTECQCVLTKDNCVPSILKGTKSGRCHSCKRKLKYGISQDTYDSMLIQQSGRCAICCKPMIGKMGACVDHNHKTGKHRELLCMSCNKFIGHAYESIEILASAIRYLQKHAGDSKNEIVPST